MSSVPCFFLRLKSRSLKLGKILPDLEIHPHPPYFNQPPQILFEKVQNISKDTLERPVLLTPLRFVRGQVPLLLDIVLPASSWPPRGLLWANSPHFVPSGVGFSRRRPALDITWQRPEAGTRVLTRTGQREAVQISKVAWHSLFSRSFNFWYHP